MTDSERRSYFDEVYARYEKRIYAYCIVIVGDRDRANDVFQEVFIKVYKALHTIKDREKIVNWIFRIARNECLNMVKTVQRSAKRHVDLDDPLYLNVGTEGSSYSDEIDHLFACINRLNPDYREVLVLAEFEGMTMKEISELTGLTMSNVKVRIHRAKRKLHTLLQPILNDYE